MKGFPNQVAELGKLTKGLAIIQELNQRGQNPRDDGVLGEALVRGGVAGAGRGRNALPVEAYLRLQRQKPLGDQSPRATARGLRELYGILGVVRVTRDSAILTSHAHVFIEDLQQPITRDTIQAWRNVLRNMSHDGGDGEQSHPYQVLLRLVAKRPGISRAKCALALEARNDSSEELERICALADLSEEEILEALPEVTKNTWDNAKKILPSLAEQLGDVVRQGRSRLYLSDAPGLGERGEEPEETPEGDGGTRGPRRPRSSRRVSADSIATSGTAEAQNKEDVAPPATPDPAAWEERNRRIADRLRRHNRLVQALARLFEAAGADLYEDPFDCLACFDALGALVEVKSLDGSEQDEVNRVREALSQLLYYESFVLDPYSEGREVVKIACFEAKISDAHIEFLRESDILVIWQVPGGFAGSEEVGEVLGTLFPLVEVVG